MPYYETSQEWLRQSTLLLEARPTTTRITTKYHISKPTSRSSRKSKAAAPDTTTPSAQHPPRGTLTLKTYDPHSGVVLKYKTTKAAEVSRLILSLGRLGRRMAGLPKESEADEAMADAPPASTTTAEGKTQAQGGSGGGAGGSGGGGGGKGKKKKGKK
ncbi:signal recognition particle 9 kDa protein-domain-containing protein [Camillea tinctor]|nr:signal recognition particle 9 kDa protein-domain-containing protein [Camillea tinctor]